MTMREIELATEGHSGHGANLAQDGRPPVQSASSGFQRVRSMLPSGQSRLRNYRAVPSAVVFGARRAAGRRRQKAGRARTRR